MGWLSENVLYPEQVDPWRSVLRIDDRMKGYLQSDDNSNWYESDGGSKERDKW